MKIHKGMMNLGIAQLLKAVAASYQIQDKKKNQFRIIAYQKAADAVEHLSSEAKDLWDDGKLEDVAGIGESIAEHLGEIFRTGKSKHFEDVMKNIPPATFELMKVSGIGPKTAIKLVSELGIGVKKPLSELEKAAKQGKISRIEGFGENSENAILASIGEVRGREKRLLLPYAQNLASEIISWLKKSEFVQKVDTLGSLRRKASTIGDIDIAVATTKSIEVIEHFCNYPKTTRVLERGKKTASIILPGNKQVDLKIQSPGSYGSLLQHFTGSKHHNIALREYALKRGLSLSENGITDKKTKEIKKLRTEEEFYKCLGMEWIPPELREGREEIETALANKLPNLIETGNIKADLQIHSDFDIETSHDLGQSSMEEVVQKANSLGYEYIAFTEHNPSQRGHNDKEITELLKRKNKQVEELNYSLQSDKKGSVKKVFNSLEIDILPDGQLPVPENALELLDFALISIHSSFKQDRDKMTKRILSAFIHPKIKIFAHPTGRKLNEREGVELDWPGIFEFCKRNKKWIEINADPMRLDLPDFLVKDAVKAGVLLTLGTDAHHVDMMDNMCYGVSVARRGWVERKDVVNTRSLEEFEKMIEL